jgi:hypothetical protein
MRYLVIDGLAAAFCGAFYRTLVAGRPIDLAVTAGRIAMRGEALRTGPGITSRFHDLLGIAR